MAASHAVSGDRSGWSSTRSPSVTAAARRTRTQRTSSATGVPAATVHPAAVAPVSHHDGPKSSSAPVPSGPAANPVSSAMAVPHTSPPKAACTAVRPRPHGCRRSTASTPTAAPAHTGTTSAAQVSDVPGPGWGSAPSSGKSGSIGSPTTPAGRTAAWVPSAKPGPRA